MTTHHDVIKLSGVQATWLVVKFNPGKKMLASTRIYQVDYGNAKSTGVGIPRR